MFRKLKDAVPPNISPEDRRRLFCVFPLAMVGVLVPLAHVVLHVASFLLTFSIPIVALIGMLWISLPVLTRTNRQG